jgi:hypothetical protein|mmetsp:Transcript_15393/g.27834  ORF Transcript_15393/g.27834 Transcript_15393/m.27834 type:complete len:99 (+) Transcript_15393:69-365(+)
MLNLVSSFDIFGRSTLPLLPEVTEGRRASFWHKTSPIGIPSATLLPFLCPYDLWVRNQTFEITSCQTLIAAVKDSPKTGWVEKDAIKLTDILAGRGEL